MGLCELQSRYTIEAPFAGREDGADATGSCGVCGTRARGVLPCPPSSIGGGLVEAPSSSLPRRAEGTVVGNGRRCLLPNMEGWAVVCKHEMLDARKRCYICPPDELREEVPSAGSFLIRAALAPSHQGTVPACSLPCDVPVVVTGAKSLSQSSALLFWSRGSCIPRSQNAPFAGPVHHNCQKIHKLAASDLIPLPFLPLSALFSLPVPLLSQLPALCLLWGGGSGAGCKQESCGWLQMRQLAGSDVPDGCVSLKYECTLSGQPAAGRGAGLPLSPLPIALHPPGPGLLVGDLGAPSQCWRPVSQWRGSFPAIQQLQLVIVWLQPPQPRCCSQCWS